MRPRILEIDALRGLALLIIFWNHLVLLVRDSGAVAGSQRLHYIQYGVSDSATTFIFLSGFVSGIVYERYVGQHGLWYAQQRALARAMQIYGAQLLVLAFLLVFGALWTGEANPLHPLWRDFADVRSDPIGKLAGLLTLQSCLDYVDILPFYIVMVPLVPLTIVGFRRMPALTLGASGLIYLTVQMLRADGFRLPMIDWFVNPWAWQMLFVGAVFLGRKWNNGALHLERNRALLIGALAVMLVGLLNNRTLRVAAHLRSPLGEERLPFLFPLGWAGKTHLEPVVLLHFAAVAYFVWYVLSRSGWVARLSILRVLSRCGQRSLPVFAAATVLDYALSIYITLRGGTVWTLVLSGALGWALLLAIPSLLPGVKPRPG